MSDDRHGLGGNNPPDEFALKREDIEARIKAFLEGGDIWNARDELDEDLAARANDFLTGAKKLSKEANDARLAETKPHRDRVERINGEWATLITMLDKVQNLVKPKLDRFLKAKRERQEAERQEAERRAREAQAAQEAARMAAANARSASEQIEAEARVEAAQRALNTEKANVRAASEPVRVASATGLSNQRGFRRKVTPRITSIALALTHFKDSPAVADLILQLAAAAERNAPTIDGVKQVPAIPGIAFDIDQELAA